MRKILLLGGSAQQLVAIEKAKSLGYYTVLCDYLLDNPGQYIADKYYPVSTTDCESLYSIAKNEQVEGILAYASDPAALPAAIVAEKLNLPTNPVESVKILGLKHHWRNFLKDNNFACLQTAQSPSKDLRPCPTTNRVRARPSCGRNPHRQGARVPMPPTEVCSTG